MFSKYKKDGDHYWQAVAPMSANAGRHDPSAIVFPPSEYKGKYTCTVQLTDAQAAKMRPLIDAVRGEMRASAGEWFRVKGVSDSERDNYIDREFKSPLRDDGQLKIRTDGCNYTEWPESGPIVKLETPLKRDDAVVFAYYVKGWTNSAGSFGATISLKNAGMALVGKAVKKEFDITSMFTD
jgi:hypothetical protein